MSREQPSIAKVTRPKLSSVVPRERLFRLLDRGGNKPVTWVASQAGSGKTTLVASWLDSRKLPCLWYQVDGGDGDLASFFYYMGLASKKATPRYKQPLPHLTREYLNSIPIFTRRYFEELFRRLKQPHVLVFDNYQDAPGDSGFDDMLTNALETVPEEMRIILLSRNDPPQQFAKLQANARMQLLDWEDIRFTPQESGELLNAQEGAKPDKKIATLLHEKTEGWAAGLVLLMARNADNGFGKQDLSDVSSGRLFDYFASELFDKTEPRIQHFLMVTSFLPVVTVSLAEQLTGIKEAQKFLEDLNKRHFFTQKHATGGQSYQYHALFREFLLARAKSYLDAGELVSIKRKAAGLLCTAGRIEDALELLRDVEAWGRICELVEEHAPEFLVEGRNKTVEAWLRAIPRPLLAQMPWALYWLGACCLPFDQIESRAYNEAAYRLFKEGHDATGCYLAWAGIADSFIYLWDDFSGMQPWLQELQVLQQEHPVFPSAQVEARVSLGAFSTLFYIDPANPLVERWRRRIETLMRELPDPNFKCQAASNLAMYYLWHGTRPDLRRVIHYIGAFRDHPEATPLSRILVRHAMAICEWNSLESDNALALCQEGLQIAEEYGVHMMDPFLYAHQVYAYGYRNSEPSVMKPILDRMRACLVQSRRIDVAHYHHIMAWYLSLCHRYEEALAHCREAAIVAELSAVSPTAFVSILTAQVLFLAGRIPEAETELKRGIEIAEEHQCSLARCIAGIVRAAMVIPHGNVQESRDAVRYPFQLAARFGFVMYSYHHPATLRNVCAFALREGIESDYAVGMIRRNRLPPPEEAPEAWPYPVRITTLGRFQILTDDRPVVFTGKVQKKPLEMLKALIAFSGAEVPEEQITEALWPDAEGDTAHRSFETTLYRLRKLIGDKTLVFRDSLLSLDPTQCWVDVWAFERVSDDVEKAIALYTGHFLPADSGQAWSVSLRERLRNRFARIVTNAGKDRERRGEREKALEYFLKGLAIDELNEEFYQHAMQCQIELGRQVQAAATYHRCKAALHRAFGIAPSARTEALYASVRSPRP